MMNPLPPSFESATSFQSLCRAAQRAAKGKTPSRSALTFVFNAELEVLALQRELCSQTYQPQPYKSFWVRDPKPRQISAAAFRDRVVHHALCAEITPALEHRAIAESFACRTGKGLKVALAHAQEGCRRFGFALKLDVKKFFETMDHDVLSRLVAECVADHRLRWLADVFIHAGAPGSPSGKGQPIGNLTSQHFANLYLGPLDRHIKRTLRAPWYARYMDDILLFSDDKPTLWRWAEAIEVFADKKLGLVLREEVTRVMPVWDGVPFLGFRIWPRLVRLDPLRVRRLRKKLRVLRSHIDAGVLTEEAAARSAQSLVGWASHANTQKLLIALVQRMDKDFPD